MNSSAELPQEMTQGAPAAEDPLSRKGLRWRSPHKTDTPAIVDLVEACPPLDRHTPYTYALLAWHFAGTCRVLENQHGALRGLITAYRLPEDPLNLFIWQIALHPEARGAGHALGGLQELVRTVGEPALTRLSATIDPDNQASRKLFAQFADSVSAPLRDTAGLPADSLSLPGAPHPDEPGIEIGPF